MTLHKFAVGQNVSFAPSRLAGNVVPDATFTIVRLLPNDASDREYRIKNVRDGQERVALESQLRSRLAAPPA